MRRLIVAVLWLTSLAGTTLALGWADHFHLSCLAVMLVLPLLLAIWQWRKGAESGDDYCEADESPPLARTLIIHGALVGLCLGYLTIGMSLLHRAGFGSDVNDHDRGMFESQLEALEGSGSHERAGAMIRVRLEQPISSSWKTTLLQRQYHDALQAGKALSAVSERRVRFEVALEIAKSNGLDDTVATTLLEECKREEQFLARLEEFRSRREWQARATLLEGSLMEPDGVSGRYPLAEWLRDTHLDWAEDEPTVQVKRTRLLRSLEVATKAKIDTSRVVLELERLNWSERDKSRPRDLAHGSKGGVLNVIHEFSPAVAIADFWVDWPNDAPVEGLAPKDLRVFCGGEAVTAFDLRELRGKSTSLFVSVLIDVSGSMKPAIFDAETGSKELLRSLTALRGHHSELRVEVLCFNDKVYRLCEWTDDLDKAVRSLHGLKADGGTALFQAVDIAVSNLKQKAGKRHLLVFTDGKDSERGPSVSDLVLRAKAEKIAVSSIGLRTDDLDSKTLKLLAMETGGHYWEAASAGDLIASFRRAAVGFRPHFYRLTFSPNAESKGLLEIRVGGENSVLISGN